MRSKIAWLQVCICMLALVGRHESVTSSLVWPYNNPRKAVNEKEFMHK